MAREQAFPIANFQGLQEEITISSDPRFSPRATNVFARFGRIITRDGYDEIFAISEVAPGLPILSLISYKIGDGTEELLRITLTSIHKLDPSARTWVDITGTALNSTDSVYVSHTVHNDILYFTNDGIDRPRKYTGSGNVTEVISQTPAAQRVISYEGFLFLGIIDTFPSTGFDYRKVRFSDAPESATGWPGENELNFREVSGRLMNWGVLGQSLFLYFNDGIVELQFIGGGQIFAQERVPFAHGLLAPGALQIIDPLGHLFLATDRRLYLNTGREITQLPLNMDKTLHETLQSGKASKSQMIFDTQQSEVRYFFPRSDSLELDTSIRYRTPTGEFGLDEYPSRSFTAFSFTEVPRSERWNEDTEQWDADTEMWIEEDRGSEKVIVAAGEDGKVYELGLDITDNGVVPAREYETGWMSFGDPQQKLLQGGIFAFRAVGSGYVDVSVAVNFSNTFVSKIRFSLTEGRDSEPFMWRITNLSGWMFNVKFEFVPATATSRLELEMGLILWTPIQGQTRVRSVS